jgi:predicted GIY-YIG superfamily endonuclease
VNLPVPWFVYLLRCGDDTLYCGIALDVEARLKQHEEGKGAKYTRGRGPLAVVYCEACDTKAAALRREREVKRLPRAAKLRLCGLSPSR